MGWIWCSSSSRCTSVAGSGRIPWRCQWLWLRRCTGGTTDVDWLCSKWHPNWHHCNVKTCIKQSHYDQWCTFFFFTSFYNMIYIYIHMDRYSHMFGVFDPYSCCQVMGGLSCHCSVSLFIKNVLELYCPWGGSTTRCQYLRHSLRVRVLNIAQQLAAGSPAVAKHVGQTPQQQAPHVSVNCMASSLATEV